MSRDPKELLAAIRAEAEKSPAAAFINLTVAELAQFVKMYDHLDTQNQKMRDLLELRLKTPELKVETTPESILAEADRLVSGERQAAYGHPYYNFTRIATGWEVIFDQVAGSITPEKVGLAMAWLKISRQLHKPSRENLVDLAGYTKATQLCVEFDPNAQPN